MLKKFVSTQVVLFLMLFLQIVWLVGIWITGASENWQKLLIVAGLSVFGYLAANLLPEFVLEKIGGWINSLADNQKRFFLILGGVLLIGGIFYASVQRIWPFDEVMNFCATKMVAEDGLGVFFQRYMLNNYLANRHPPLIFILNGLVASVFGVSVMSSRMVTLAFAFAMLVTSFLLASSLYGKRTGVLTVLLLLSFPLIFRESTAGLLDIQATFFFALTLLLALKLADRPSWKLGLILGLSLGLGLVTKYMVMFIIPLLGLFFVLRGNYRATVVPVLLSFSVAGALFLAWTWYGAQIGVRVPSVAGFSPSELFAAKQTVRAAPVENDQVIEDITISPGYFLTSDWGRAFLINSLSTRLTSAVGAYTLPLLLLGLVQLLRERKRSDWFVLMWIAVTCALLILTLPDHRYFLVIFPALAISGARWAETQSTRDLGRLALVLVICQIAALYLLVDWSRGNELFPFLNKTEPPNLLCGTAFLAFFGI